MTADDLKDCMLVADDVRNGDEVLAVLADEMRCADAYVNAICSGKAGCHNGYHKIGCGLRSAGDAWAAAVGRRRAL